MSYQTKISLALVILHFSATCVYKQLYLIRDSHIYRFSMFMLLQVILLFETYPAFVCLREMERILVQWSNERSKGMTSLERKTAVNTGVITVSEKVVVSWGKTKKTYNAQVISLSSTQAPASHGTTRNALEDQFCCNVADPALSTADPAPSTAYPAPSSGDQDPLSYKCWTACQRGLTIFQTCCQVL